VFKALIDIFSVVDGVGFALGYPQKPDKKHSCLPSSFLCDSPSSGGILKVQQPVTKNQPQNVPEK